MLKAKYYPRGHLLDTAFASNPSQTWQAILHGLELLKKGVIWRIGDGRQIRIWRDPWIPRGFSHRVTTLRGRNRFHWVADLMNSDGSNWDYNRIASIFNAADREAISKIRLGQRRTEDFIAWQPEKTGKFSVRSAYNIALMEKIRDSSQASSNRPEGDRKLWSNIWNCQIPPKVKIFAWKLGRDILPTKQNKFRRNLEPSPECDLCGQGEETCFHAAMVCPHARALREAMRQFWDLPGEEQCCFTGGDWLLILLDNCTDEQRCTLLLLLWRTWYVHNNIVHGAGPTSVGESVGFLLSFWDSLNTYIAPPYGDNAKGKEPCQMTMRTGMPKQYAVTLNQHWKLPQMGG